MLATASVAITHLGSSSLLVPLSALYATALWRRHSAPMAMRWLLALAVCLGVMVVLKLVGHGCGLPEFPLYEALFPGDRFISPSGHAAFSAVFYGSVAALAARNADSRWLRLGLPAAAVALVLAISASRVVVSAHSRAEVAVGLLVGGLSVLLFLWTSRKDRAPRLRTPLWLLGIMAIGLALLVHAGDPSFVEAVIRRVAYQLAYHVQGGGLCAFAGLPLPGHPG
ncbi:phosphatase PAP2 family protein [Azospirillum picis]|uniref:Membrane-associated phospholipid phosphatase n=1 Tax=Azospirillum picis TaxID=488438 RepID=A0ABU0MEW7_9PROT|nr:phosphatase PAP2 family protein [Azospirillum picis]MBP2298142.1 membrane-associated phospholipid phosphatase [Azospirillum picis]MDQ0531980.1 membrane-associated phospholipid phosphatase [Azospirillum picis]